VPAVDGGHAAVVVAVVAGTGDEIGVAKAHLAARCEPEVLLGRVDHEVVALDEQLAAEGYLAGAEGLIGGMVGGGEVLDLRLRVVGDYQSYRVENRHATRSRSLQVFAYAAFRQRHLDAVVALGDADSFAKIADRRRRVAAAP